MNKTLTNNVNVREPDTAMYVAVDRQFSHEFLYQSISNYSTRSMLITLTCKYLIKGNRKLVCCHLPSVRTVPYSEALLFALESKYQHIYVYVYLYVYAGAQRRE